METIINRDTRLFGNRQTRRHSTSILRFVTLFCPSRCAANLIKATVTKQMPPDCGLAIARYRR